MSSRNASPGIAPVVRRAISPTRWPYVLVWYVCRVPRPPPWFGGGDPAAVIRSQCERSSFVRRGPIAGTAGAVAQCVAHGGAVLAVCREFGPDRGDWIVEADDPRRRHAVPAAPPSPCRPSRSSQACSVATVVCAPRRPSLLRARRQRRRRRSRTLTPPLRRAWRSCRRRLRDGGERSVAMAGDRRVHRGSLAALTGMNRLVNPERCVCVSSRHDP